MQDDHFTFSYQILLPYLFMFHVPSPGENMTTVRLGIFLLYLGKVPKRKVLFALLQLLNKKIPFRSHQRWPRAERSSSSSWGCDAKRRELVSRFVPPGECQQGMHWHYPIKSILDDNNHPIKYRCWHQRHQSLLVQSQKSSASSNESCLLLSLFELAPRTLCARGENHLIPRPSPHLHSPTQKCAAAKSMPSLSVSYIDMQWLNVLSEGWPPLLSSASCASRSISSAFISIVCIRRMAPSPSFPCLFTRVDRCAEEGARVQELVRA